jgi:hypothetical protein
MIGTYCVGPETFIRQGAYRRAMLPHRSRIATWPVNEIRPIRRTGRFCLPDVVENPRRKPKSLRRNRFLSSTLGIDPPPFLVRRHSRDNQTAPRRLFFCLRFPGSAAGSGCGIALRQVTGADHRHLPGRRCRLDKVLVTHGRRTQHAIAVRQIARTLLDLAG